MDEPAMRAALAGWFRAHPETGRGRGPGATTGAFADTFLAYATPSFRFDADGSPGTAQDSTTVFVGESVLWQLVNGSHTVTSGVPGEPGAGSIFNVGLNPGATSFTFTFPTEGRFPFFCSLHDATMRGVVRVLGLIGVEPLPATTGRPGFLARPAPNPARDFVVVRFGLARAGRAQLDVLDLRGRRVARPLDGVYGKGGYGMRWDCRSGNGRRVPAGVYFLRLRVPGATASERIVVTE
jgi:plastocyanin